MIKDSAGMFVGGIVLAGFTAVMATPTGLGRPLAVGIFAGFSVMSLILWKL